MRADFSKQETFRIFAEILAKADDITLMQAAAQALDDFWGDDDQWINLSNEDREDAAENLLWQVSAVLKRVAFQPINPGSDSEPRLVSAEECIHSTVKDIFARADLATAKEDE